MSEAQKPHYHGHRKRLKERFLKGGIDALQEYELLEILLAQAIPRRDVKPLAKELITKFKSFSGVLNAEYEELVNTKGLGEGSAFSLKFSAAIARFYASQAVKKTPLKSKIDLLDYLYTKISTLTHEEFHVVYLDSKNNIITDECLFRGTVNCSSVYPREVIKEALKRGANGIVMVHNHPSGDPTPSIDDEKLTSAMMQAAAIMGIRIHDHIIIGNKTHYSFADKGKL